MKKETKTELCAIALLIAMLAGFVAVSSAVLIPKRQDFGATWGRYLKEEENTVDVLFFGSSITYCDVVPAVIWKDSEITSYVMAGPEQTIPITYYYVREAMKTQHPNVIMIEVTGVFFAQYQNYTKVNVGYMPWDENRFGAVFHAAEREERTGLLFPLYHYHSRWDALSGEDVAIAWNGYAEDDLAGYTFLDAAEEMTEIQPRNEVFDAENYGRNIGYLQKIDELCEDNGVIPVYYIAPTYFRLSDEHLEMLKSDIEEMDNARWIDFNKRGGLAAYDPALDYYDMIHFNFRGAKKFSAQLAEFLASELKIPPTDPADTERWNRRVQKFRDLCWNHGDDSAG